MTLSQVWKTQTSKYRREKQLSSSWRSTGICFEKPRLYYGLNNIGQITLILYYIKVFCLSHYAWWELNERGTQRDDGRGQKENGKCNTAVAFQNANSQLVSQLPAHFIVSALDIKMSKWNKKWSATVTSVFDRWTEGWNYKDWSWGTWGKIVEDATWSRGFMVSAESKDCDSSFLSKAVGAAITVVSVIAVAVCHIPCATGCSCSGVHACSWWMLKLVFYWIEINVALVPNWKQIHWKNITWIESSRTAWFAKWS